MPVPLCHLAWQAVGKVPSDSQIKRKQLIQKVGKAPVGP